MPKTFILILVLIVVNQMVYALENISELKWNNRIILARSIDESRELLNTLNNFKDDIQERDIYWFLFSDDKVETNYQGSLKDKFYNLMLEKYFKDTKTNVVLIGKDGGIKQNNGYLDLKELFDLIDSMPMRQLEMSE